MFITLEGIEGCGKSTQSKLLKDWLEKKGREVFYSREPGGTRLGKKIRSILLDAENFDLTKKSELFLYLADRSQHVCQMIQPALKGGKIVILDRYADSTIVYQGYGRGLDIDLLYNLNDIAISGLWPDLTILLDVPVKIGLSRARSRNKADDKSISEGRFEAESLAFHDRIRQGYWQLAKKNKDRYVVIDGTEQKDRVFSRIKDKLERLFQDK